MTLTDLDLLTRAVVTQPDEDTPRLIWADAVQEAGDAARAEFICVQVELWQQHNGYFTASEANDRRQDWLEARERDLLARHGAAWRPPCFRCAGKGDVLVRSEERGGLAGGSWAPCERCEGSGRAAGTLVRGFPLLDVRLADAGSLTNHDEWKFGFEWLAWACRAVRECGTSFHETTREPGPGDNDRLYGWWKGDPAERLCNLPAVLWDEVAKLAVEMHGDWADFLAADDARRALDAALSRLIVARAFGESA